MNKNARAVTERGVERDLFRLPKPINNQVERYKEISCSYQNMSSWRAPNEIICEYMYFTCNRGMEGKILNFSGVKNGVFSGTNFTGAIILGFSYNNVDLSGVKGLTGTVDLSHVTGKINVKGLETTGITSIIIPAGYSISDIALDANFDRSKIKVAKSAEYKKTMEAVQAANTNSIVR